MSARQFVARMRARLFDPADLGLQSTSQILQPPPPAARVPFGLVLSGGGSRTAYQIGALKALLPYIESTSDGISVIVGSSLGAVNGIVLGSVLQKTDLATAIAEVESMWLERTFRNTFCGAPSTAFLRAIKIAILRYNSPGPHATRHSIFDPTPLMNRVDDAIARYSNMPDSPAASVLRAMAVMTTVEGEKRSPLLFVAGKDRHTEDAFRGSSSRVVYVDQLTSRHGFASAALPSVLPAVEIDLEDGRVRLVDGGICENVPVDPAMRLGAERIILIDASGREWWFNHYGEPLDTRPEWEVPAAESSFCYSPLESIVLRNKLALGPVLRDAVKSSTGAFIRALGPTWPIYSLLKRKMGEDLAYEVMTYVALDRDYIAGLIERGYNETLAAIQQKPAEVPEEDKVLATA